MTSRAAALLVLVTLLAGCSSAEPDAAGSSPQPTATVSPSVAPTPTASPRPIPTPTPTPNNDDPLSPRPAIESPAPLGQPPCRASAVTVTDADALTTDRAVQELFVIRTEGKPCQLDGWPTVTLLDAAGHAIKASVQHGGYDLPPMTPAPVTLSMDTSLSFFVATARSGGCVQAATLLVTLPGTSTQLRAATSMSVCGGGVGVSPIHRLADDEGASG